MTTARRPQADMTTFAALDMRVARVVEVSPFPQARKPALQLTLDVGGLGRLRTSAQITRYDLDGLVGRLVVVVVNLGDRRIAGFVSECLVLAAVGGDGQPHLLSVDDGANPGDPVA